MNTIPPGAEQIELSYIGYIDPEVVHALKTGPVAGTVTKFGRIELDSLGHTGLKLPRTSDYSVGDGVIVTFSNGLFYCRPVGEDESEEPTALAD